ERAARAPVFHRGRGGAELHPGRGAPGHDPAAVVGGHRQARAQARCDAARADQPPRHLDPGPPPALLEQGRIAVEGLGAAFERARRRGTQAGRLSVAVKPGSGTDLIKTIMQRCARDPRMPRVHILFGHPGGPAAAVRGGAADVGILRTPFDQRGLATELLLTEPPLGGPPSRPPPRTAASRAPRRGPAVRPPPGRPARTAPRRPGRPADAALDRTGPDDPAAHAYWPGADTSSATRNQDDRHTGTVPGPEINDISQLLDAVTLGNAVAY